MATTTLTVGSAAGPYPVHIAPGLSRQLASLLDQQGLGPRRVVAASPRVWKLHGASLREGLAHAEVILVPDGESQKQVQSVLQIYEALIRAGADRSITIVAVGGGVIGDMVGFAAATYLRGVPLVHVPTTLLAQVDSCIGGKVGVNHPLGKNLIGAFHPPSLVGIDPLLLQTLPRREFRAGLYEVVKYGVIASADLFHQLCQHPRLISTRDPELLSRVILECCQIKARVVEADEREQGQRRILNFGHTVGHALEALTQYRRFRHGEAVAYGMLAAAEVAVNRGALPPGDRDQLSQLVAEMGPLPPVGDLSASQTVEIVRRDKKIIAGTLHFVLPVAIGRVVMIEDLSEAELTRGLHSLGLRGTG